MPLHDWTRMPAGLFHHFHQHWSIEIAKRLNQGMLPKGLSALIEQRTPQKEPDVLAVERQSSYPRPGANGGLLLVEPPATKIVRRSAKEAYSKRANRIVVRHHLGKIVAVIEIVSPGNKSGRAAVRDFVEKTSDFLREGIHVSIVDAFPPTPRDPVGMHKLIWDEISEEEFALPEGKDRLIAAYEAGGDYAAYVEPFAVGDELPDMPLFLAPGVHIQVPLESTYGATWDASPEELRLAVETGVLPNPDVED